MACARALIGATLSFGPCSGRIVETEAYLAVNDDACHAAMFRPIREFLRHIGPGTTYIYKHLGVHWLLNFAVKGVEDGFVLIRALEPKHGLSVMQRRRNQSDLWQLCSGPGKLTAAFGITGTLHGQPYPSVGLTLAWNPEAPPPSIGASVRIGITRAADRPWRFYEQGNPHVSQAPRPSPFSTSTSHKLKQPQKHKRADKRRDDFGERTGRVEA